MMFVEACIDSTSENCNEVFIIFAIVCFLFMYFGT